MKIVLSFAMMAVVLSSNSVQAQNGYKFDGEKIAVTKKAVKKKLIEKGPGTWYEGGNLHNLHFSEWYRGTESNRLATAADFVASSFLLKYGNKMPFKSMDELKPFAKEMSTCLTEAGKEGVAGKVSNKVSEMATLCVILLGYSK